MREIKCRVWTGDTMLQVVKLNLLKRPNGEYMEPGQGYFLNGLRKGEHVDFSMKSAEFLQYTGLKDRNDKDIYEGDIYHMGDENITYTVVRHDTGLTGKQNGSNSYAGLSHWQERIKIVGNIYENPELIK